MKDATNWRVQFERHPLALLGVAFAGGILLSAGLGGRSRQDHDVGHVRTPRTGRPASGAASSVPTEIWDGLKGALIGAASTQIRSVLHELVPGFRQHEQSAVGAPVVRRCHRRLRLPRQ